MMPTPSGVRRATHPATPEQLHRNDILHFIRLGSLTQ